MGQAVIADLAQERARAVTALKDAERAMLEHSHDPEAFSRAEQELSFAQAEMRRIAFVERHEAELAQRAVLDKRRSDLAEAQERARKARERSTDLAAKIGPLVERFVAIVRDLKDAHAAIERGVHFEAFAVRDGLLDRPTISPGLGAVDGEIGVQALRAAKELVKLTPVSPQLADLKASQRSL